MKNPLKVLYQRLHDSVPVTRVREKLDDPIMADRSMDLMAAGVWTSLACWGFASIIVGLPTIAIATPPFYELVWGSVITTSASIAAIAAYSTFWFTDDILLRIKRKRVEFASVLILEGFAMVYPALLGISALSGDTGRVAAFFAALIYIIVPAWRLRHLSRRMKKLREVLITERQRSTE